MNSFVKNIDIYTIATTVLGYELSYLELIGTVSGLICVWLAAKQYILTWPIGLINILCLFIIFYKSNLYADMFLQVYFLIVAIYGWYTWTYHKSIDKNITILSNRFRIIITISIFVVSLLMGFYMANIHHTLPTIFSQPASFPFLDSFIAIGSVFANIMMARRVLENWILWIIIDVIAVYVYFQKGILFIATLYAIYCWIAWKGFTSWRKERFIK